MSVLMQLTLVSVFIVGGVGALTGTVAFLVHRQNQRKAREYRKSQGHPVGSH